MSVASVIWNQTESTEESGHGLNDQQSTHSFGSETSRSGILSRPTNATVVLKNISIFERSTESRVEEPPNEDDDWIEPEKKMPDVRDWIVRLRTDEAKGLNCFPSVGDHCQLLHSSPTPSRRPRLTRFREKHNGG